MLNKLRNWILNWLGVDASIASVERRMKQAVQSAADELHGKIDATRKEAYAAISKHAEQLYAIESANANAVSRIAQMELDGPQAIQALQEQITALGASPSKPKPGDDEPQMLSGHVRFTDRKKQYEASKRVPPMNETGKQIAENVRLIASGARKE